MSARGHTLQSGKRKKRAGLRLRVLCPLAIGLVALTVAAVATRQEEYAQYLNSEALERTSIARSAIQKQFREDADVMHSLLLGLSSNRAYSDAFLAGDRQALQALAKPAFEDMRERVHVSHFYFHGADRRVFLRMHNPASYGDLIDRRTLLDAQSKSQATVGFERGPFAAFAQRAVLPWRVDGQTIGYLELSMDLDRTAHTLREQLGIDLFAVVEKDKVNQAVWQAGLEKYQRAGNWNEFDDVVVMDRTIESLPEPMAGYLNTSSAESGYSILELQDGRTVVAQSVPITDVREENLARLAVFTDVSDVANSHRDALWQVFSVCAVVSLGLFAFFFVFFGRVENKLESRRVALEDTNQKLAGEIKERAKIEDALKEERARLEEKVQERTRELSDTNDSLRKAVAARARAESDLDLIFCAMPDMIIVGGSDGFLKRVNPVMAEFTGYSEQELLTTPFNDFADPNDLPRVYRDLARLAEGEAICNFYLRTRHKDGHWLETEWNSVPFGNGMFLSIGRDISQRMNAKRKLLKANEALKREVEARAKAESEVDFMFSTTPDMLALGGFDGFFKRVNPAMARLSGYTEEELLARPFIDFVDPEQLPVVKPLMERLVLGEDIKNMHLRIRHKDGHFLDTEWHNLPFVDRRMFLTVGRDISERMHAERRLIETNDTLKAEVTARAAAQRELDQLFTSSLDLLCLAGFDGYIKRVNPSFSKAFDYTEEELLKMPFMDLVHPDDLRVATDRLVTLSEGGKLTEVVIRIRTKSGRIRHTQWNLVPFLERGMLFAAGRDITDIKNLEDSLRETAAKLCDAQRIGKVGSWEADLRTGESEWSDEALRIYGFEPGEVKPSLDFFFSMVHPDDRERMRTLDGIPPRDGEHRLHEHRIVLRDGTVRDLLVNIEFSCDENGQPFYLRGTCQDITERKEAERMQTALEERLRVSQKMDAVGALAGGVAHDFNNLMSVILTYVGFVQDTLAFGDPILDDLNEVEKAAERAATLTRQLLAFGRKQVFQPVPLDLNNVAEGLDKMLRRIIGENIELAQDLTPDLGATIADPGQLEQVLMNLVLNARDAMPGGGRVTIRTANIEVSENQAASHAAGSSHLIEPMRQGSYVMLAVTDTGCGMDAQTLDRLFEPFFTTKEVGKGTGLGLPTVYGIVKQSKGFILVDSEPGRGSTFAIYLPREKNGTALIRRKPTEVVPAVGDETVLVVEDETAVRNSAVRILADAGYQVLSAANGREALELCGKYDGDIHLVLTDVVMPEMNGAELAKQLAHHRPDTRVLFMSGYSGDAIAEHGVLDRDTHLIGKPFNAADLTTKVRHVLDAAAAGTVDGERQVP